MSEFPGTWCSELLSLTFGFANAADNAFVYVYLIFHPTGRFMVPVDFQWLAAAAAWFRQGYDLSLAKAARGINDTGMIKYACGCATCR